MTRHVPDNLDLGWTDKAACRGEPPRRFTSPRGPDDTEQAIKTCASCAVRRRCLATALAHRPEADVGIWGGTNERTRERIRRGQLTVEDALAVRDHEEAAALCPPSASTSV